MIGKLLNYEEIMNKIEEKERERKEVLEWYKKRIEVMSKRAK